MIKTDELFSQAAALPAPAKSRLIELLLASLHPDRKDVDDLWAEEAEKRAESFLDRKTARIPGKRAFKKFRTAK